MRYALIHPKRTRSPTLSQFGIGWPLNATPPTPFEYASNKALAPSSSSISICLLFSPSFCGPPDRQIALASFARYRLPKYRIKSRCTYQIPLAASTPALGSHLGVSEQLPKAADCSSPARLLAGQRRRLSHRAHQSSRANST